MLSRLQQELDKSQRNLAALEAEVRAKESVISLKEEQITIAHKLLSEAHDRIGKQKVEISKLNEDKRKLELEKVVSSQFENWTTTASDAEKKQLLNEGCQLRLKETLLDLDLYPIQDIYFNLDETEFQNKQISDEKMKSIMDIFFSQGIVAIKNVVPLETIIELNKTATSVFYDLLEWYNMRFAEGRGHTYNEMAKRSEGRFDINYGFDNPMWKELDDHPIIHQVIRNLLSGNLDRTKLQWSGIVMCQKGCDTQRWHVDGDDVFLDRSGNRIPGMPPHVINVFIPMIDIRSDTGPTTFFRGSQRDPWAFPKKPEEEKMRRAITIEAERGSVIFFDYRTLHRGEQNIGEFDRPMKYYTYSMSWFQDAINFPTTNSLFQDIPTTQTQIEDIPTNQTQDIPTNQSEDIPTSQTQDIPTNETQDTQINISSTN